MKDSSKKIKRMELDYIMKEAFSIKVSLKTIDLTEREFKRVLTTYSLVFLKMG